MSVGVIIALVFLLLCILLATRLPVALALAASGAAGILLLEGPETMLQTMASVPYQAVSSYSLMVIPMFILMGMLVMKTTIATDMFSVADRMLRWLPGGLGAATIGVCSGFAAVTGSSVATVATLGRMCVNEMRSRGYTASFAAGIVGAGGTLGVLIPPSIPLVIYGVLTGVSIGALMIAAIIPGILTALAYALLIVIRVKRNPELVNDTTWVKHTDTGIQKLQNESAHVPTRAADVVTQTMKPHAGLPSKEGKGQTRKGLLAVSQVALLFVIVIGGIYSGIFTVTESGAIGALAALVMLILNTVKSPRDAWKKLTEAFRESAVLTSVIFGVLIGAGFLTYFLVISRVPSNLTRAITGLDIPPIVVVILFLLFLIPLGMFLDSISILVITVPLMYPALDALGVDGIWLGILIVKLVEIGLITPPVGLNAFVLSGSVPRLPVHTVFKGLFPFVLLELGLVVLFLLVPELITFLPNLIR